MQTRLNEEYYSRIEKKRRFFLKSRAKSRLTCGGSPRWRDRTPNDAERVGFRPCSERRGGGSVALILILQGILSRRSTERRRKRPRKTTRAGKSSARRDEISVSTPLFGSAKTKENERRKREKVAARRRTTKIFLRSDPTTRF